MIYFVYLGLGDEEMRLQRREEGKIKIDGDIPYIKMELTFQTIKIELTFQTLKWS